MFIMMMKIAQNSRSLYNQMLSTAQILSYNELLFYAIIKTLIIYNFSKRNIKAP